jgi:hypothetical protein
MIKQIEFEVLSSEWDSMEHVVVFQPGEVERHIRLIDDDFTECMCVSAPVAVKPAHRLAAIAVRALIKTYSKRQLRVATNLWLLLQILEWRYLPSLKEHIDFLHQHVPEYLPYHEEILTFSLFS